MPKHLTRQTTRSKRRPLKTGNKRRKQVLTPLPPEAGDHAREREQKRRELPPTFHLPPDIEAAKARAIQGMREGGVIAEACRASRIGRRKIYDLLKADPAFRQAMRDARNDNLDELEYAMAQRGRWAKGDLAGIFVMKHRRAAFADGPTRVELTGKDGGPVLHADAREELGRRLDKLAAALQGEAIDVTGTRKGPALVSDGDGARGVRRVSGSAGSGKPKRGVRVG